jgi:hypothetical protein
MSGFGTTGGANNASSTAARPAPNAAAAEEREPSVILTMARYISASWTRYEELERRALDLARAERAGAAALARVSNPHRGSDRPPHSGSTTS